MRPAGLKYTNTHEWVRIENGIAVVGITDFAVSQLSDLVYLEPPKVGKQVKKDEPCGEIESVKAVAEFNAPVSGEIVSVNEKLANAIETVTKDPFGEGWIAKIKMSNPAEAGSLLDDAGYDGVCAQTH